MKYKMPSLTVPLISFTEKSTVMVYMFMYNVYSMKTFTQHKWIKSGQKTENCLNEIKSFSPIYARIKCSDAIAQP